MHVINTLLYKTNGFGILHKGISHFLFRIIQRNSIVCNTMNMSAIFVISGLKVRDTRQDVPWPGDTGEYEADVLTR
jgi:hypothetical protein